MGGWSPSPGNYPETLVLYRTRPARHGGTISGLDYDSHLLRLVDWFAPLGGSDQAFRPANRDFYIRASNGLVTRSVAGYSYRGNWASSTGGSCTR
jgi:hypothetical protein